MKRLIILRGPAGSGKTTVSMALRDKIGENDTYVLDLDVTHHDEHKFNRNLEDCLQHRNVIGEIFYGNSHTTNPTKWIVRFKDAGYNILSVILFCNKEVCIDRCKKDNTTRRHSVNREKDTISKYYDEFYQREQRTPFHIIAGIKGIMIETESKSTIEVAEDILRNFTRLFPKYR